MIIAGYDIETTGLLAPEHRIIEIYIGLWKPDGTRVFEYERRIDPQRSITAEAQRVHGIAGSDLVGKPVLETLAPDIVKIFGKANLEVAHNGAYFDAPFLEQELKRCGYAKPARPMVDTMLEGLWAHPEGKRPQLGELCFSLGVDYDPARAHAASYDVERMMECFFRGLNWGWIKLPEIAA